MELRARITDTGHVILMLAEVENRDRIWRWKKHWVGFHQGIMILKMFDSKTPNLSL
jgi:hypothetical protein